MSRWSSLGIHATQMRFSAWRLLLRFPSETSQRSRDWIRTELYLRLVRWWQAMARKHLWLMCPSCVSGEITQQRSFQTCLAHRWMALPSERLSKSRLSGLTPAFWPQSRKEALRLLKSVENPLFQVQQMRSVTMWGTCGWVLQRDSIQVWPCSVMATSMELLMTWFIRSHA